MDSHGARTDLSVGQDGLCNLLRQGLNEVDRFTRDHTMDVLREQCIVHSFSQVICACSYLSVEGKGDIHNERLAIVPFTGQHAVVPGRLKTGQCDRVVVIQCGSAPSLTSVHYVPFVVADAPVVVNTPAPAILVVVQ